MARTVDGKLHKINIIENDQYNIENEKDGTLQFEIYNGGKKFVILSRNVNSFDFNMIDRLIRAICVDTKSSTNVFHHILAKK